MMAKFTNSRRKGRVAGHVRSASLPCQCHPLVMFLEEKIGDVQSWVASGDTSLDSIEAGLSQVELLVLAVYNFLNLSDTQTMIQHDSSLTEYLLEDFLCLIDSYGSVLSNLVELKQHQFEVQSALRRHDSARLALSLKSQKRIQKNLNYLMVSLRAPTKSMSMILASNTPEVNTLGIMKDAISAMSAASKVLFSKVSAISAAASSTATSLVMPMKVFRKKISDDTHVVIHVKFEELEHCVRIVEDASNKVLKSLVNCRVALLDIQSNSL